MLEPHPNVPVLATSGLDHDIKIFLPTAGHPTDLKDLSDVCCFLLLVILSLQHNNTNQLASDALTQDRLLWVLCLCISLYTFTKNDKRQVVCPLYIKEL